MAVSLSDWSFLTSYGFFSHYQTFRERLLAIGRATYKFLRETSGIRPDRLDCEIDVEEALVHSTVFVDIMIDLSRNTNLPEHTDPYWVDYFAGPIARFVVDSEWQEISV
jgi:hypothetical protein